MRELIEAILASHALHYKAHSAVSGGDINETFAIETNDRKLFLKINSAARFPNMFATEAEGLQALHKASGFKVPSVMAYGEIEDQQYLLMEWLDKAAPSPSFWQQFAASLAQLHKATNVRFGWTSSNYIGSLPQQNEPHETWATFYATQRILPLIKQLFENGNLAKADIVLAEALCKKLTGIFPNEAPALLHGDLWAGNFMAVKKGDGIVLPSIFDPAVYYGHREMDIGMSLLFGGFDNRMYALYNEVFPLEKHWRQRVSLTQLYPLLVHAILFGGGYVESCRGILKQWS